MDWVDIVWPLMGGVSLTLGLIYLLVWIRQRQQPSMLAFAVAATAVSLLAVIELLMMHSLVPSEYLTLRRSGLVAVAILMCALVAFVLLHFHAGRAWLGWTACGLRIAVLLGALIAGTDPRLAYVQLVQRVDFLGATVTAPIARASPWMIPVNLSVLLLCMFFADALVQVLRRSRDEAERRHAIVVLGGMLLFVLLGAAWSTAIATGRVVAPVMGTLPFLLMLLVMAYDLRGKVERATRLELRLRESESNLRSLQSTANAVGMGLWMWDLRSGEHWFTDAGSAQLGLGEDGRIGHETFLRRVHPDDHPTVMRAREDAVRGGRFECEFRLVHPDGSLHWLAASGRVEQSPVDGPTLMRGAVIDVTERRQAEERFRLVVESSPTAMLMVDTIGRITLANAQAAHLFGHSRDELIGEHIELLVPPHVRGRHSGMRSAYMRNPAARSMGIGREINARRKDGTDVRVEIALTPVRVGDEQHVLTSITDISERLRTEQEVAIQRDELAHLSRISLLGEMSASLAHELNQPLAAVLSNAQAALRFLDRETPDLVEVRESLLHIVENDKRAGEVIRRLRAMLRKEQSDYQPLLLNEVVHDVLRLVSSDLVNRNVSVTLDLAPALPFVLGDRVQLQQVLLNLIFNACEAMEALPRDRVVTIRTRLAADAHVQVEVCDVGPGIPEADLERIFTPFVTTKAQGMGLGLAVCRTILQAHRGLLRATSTPAGGAMLAMLLPPLGYAAGETGTRHPP